MVQASRKEPSPSVVTGGNWLYINIPRENIDIYRWYRWHRYIYVHITTFPGFLYLLMLFGHHSQKLVTVLHLRPDLPVSNRKLAINIECPLPSRHLQCSGGSHVMNFLLEFSKRDTFIQLQGKGSGIWSSIHFNHS